MPSKATQLSMDDPFFGGDATGLPAPPEKKSLGGTPAEKAIRWTTAFAGQEFNRDPRVVRVNLSKLGIPPGPDDRFSTADIVKACFGDKEAESLRKVKESADEIALRNEKMRGILIEADTVYNHFENVFVALRQHILALEIPEENKDEIIDNLRMLKTKIPT